MTTIKLGLFSAEMMEQELLNYLIIFVKNNPTHKFTVYTSIPGSRLNGGRMNAHVLKDDYLYLYGNKNCLINVGHQHDVTEEFLANVDLLNREGISVDFVLNNRFVDQADLEDTVLRGCLGKLSVANSKHGTNNGIIYTRDLVREVIMSEFSDSLRYSASVIKFYDEYPDFTYEQGLAEADSVVLMHRHSNDIDLLESIPKTRRGDVYIIVNSPCRVECTPQRATEHYTAISRYNRGEPFDEKKGGCDFQDPKFTLAVVSEGHADYLRQMGFSFKLGRQVVDIDYNFVDPFSFLLDHPHFLKS